MNTSYAKWALALAAVIIIGILVLVFMPAPSKAPAVSTTGTGGYKDATYTIDGAPVTLVDGKSEVGDAAAGVKITTTIFGEPTMGDLNNDGKPDAALLLVQNAGGSGTFYYLAAALTTDTGATGTNTILLGDRIAPQTLEIKEGVITANYADRNPGEPMTTRPSLGVSKYAGVLNGVLTEIAGPGAPVTVGLGAHCGGFIKDAPVCAAGLHCQLKVNMPDTGGVCVKN